MLKLFTAAAIALSLVSGFSVVAPSSADAASCTGSFNTCATRCKTKYATDKSCVSDHCTPKLATCKSSGCWQQGGDFGNVLTCNLDRK